MPYEAARTRIVIARACLTLGDLGAAQLELEAARTTFERLGARPDLEPLDALAERGTVRRGELTEHELEVLRLVATGRTNRDIATMLMISTHTVARHLQNIFVKLNLSSRAAATA